MYNFDKTKFRIGYGRQQKIITKEKKAHIMQEDLKNRDFILSIKYISSNRLVILNIIILSGKSCLKEFFLNNDLDKNIIMAVSDIEYNNNELSLHWLEHFAKNI